MGGTRSRDAAKIGGMQVPNLDFTLHIEEIHIQITYNLCILRRFTIPVAFTERVDKSIRTGNKNKKVGTDGINVALLQAVAIICSRILTARWETFGWLAMLPGKWAEVLLSALYTKKKKKGAQDDPANYRPVWLLSHACKVIDCPLLSILWEFFTLTSTHYCLPAELSVYTSLLRAKSNAEWGLHHDVVL